VHTAKPFWATIPVPVPSSIDAFSVVVAGLGLAAVR
jgi:hypothetical protein